MTALSFLASQQPAVNMKFMDCDQLAPTNTGSHLRKNMKYIENLLPDLGNRSKSTFDSANILARHIADPSPTGARMTQYPRSIAMIHTVSGLIPVFDALLRTERAGWQGFNKVDESPCAPQFETAAPRP